MASHATVYLSTSAVSFTLSQHNPNDLLPHLDELIEATACLAVTSGPYEVVHSHYWIAGVAAREVVRRQPMHHVHSVLSLGRKRLASGVERNPADLVRDAAEVRVFDEANRVVVSCPSEHEDLTRLYPEVRGDNVRVIPYGADENVFFPRPESPGDYVRRQTTRIAKGTTDFS